MKSKILDAVGISAAALCLVHCIVFPLLIVLPLGLSHNPYIDMAFFVIGIAVVYKVTWQITEWWLKALFWISILMIGISISADFLFEIHLPLIYVGAVGLITGHLINFKNHKH